ncbi:MAG: GIY-YIG nuclease family protein [Lentimicrobium sp.]|nr:GIY-YIG nuclease family protein [Lentimicrobium sp.]
MATSFFMIYTVYVIKSQKDGRLYKGMSTNVEFRLKEHNSGRNFSTSPYKPWKLVYTKEFPDRNQARNWEKYLKSGIGREYLKKFLSEN